MPDQSITIDLTVGDTGVILSGTIKHRTLISLTNLTGYSLQCSLLNTDGGPDFFANKTAVLGALDATKGTVAVSYRLVTNDVSAPGTGKIRWTLITPDLGIIHAPGARDRQTYYRINP